MKKAWPVVKLGEVICHRKEFVTIDDLTTYRRPRVQLHVQGIVLRDAVPGALIKTKTQQVCRTGEFLVAEIDAKVGGFGIVPEALDGSIVSSHYFLFVIDEGALDRRFLDYFIRTPAFREQVAAQGSTNYAAIRPGHVLAHEIPLPQIAEQRRVVARIEELAAHIHEARTLRHQAAAEAAVLMESWSRRILGTLEKPEWKLNELQSVCSVFIDCDHKTPDYLEEGIALLRPRDIKPESLTIAGTVRISEAEHEKRCERHRPVEGDIVYSRELSFGNAAMIPRDCVVSLGQGTLLVRADETKIEKRFLLKALNAPIIREQAAKAAKGAAHPHVNLKDIRVFGLPLPPLANQRRILAELDDLQAQVDALKRLQTETAAELGALLPSILDRAFKGEL